MVAVELPAEITASFVAEARSYLPLISASLADLSNAEALSEAYRFAHTIKSSAAMMGHDGLSQMAELLEADLECLMLGEAATAGQAAQLGRSVGRIARLLDGVTGVAVDVDLVLAEEVEDRMALDEPTVEERVEEPAEEIVEDAVEEVAPPAIEVFTIAVVEPEALREVEPELDPEPEARTEPPIVVEPQVAVLPAVEAASAAEPDLVTPPTAQSGFEPLLDTLAETVLAFGREVATGAADPIAHRNAVAAWLSEFEQRAGIERAPEPVVAVVPAEPTAWERETRERREALLRAAVEAELRLEIEHEVRARIAVERPEPVNPFVSLAARRRTPSPRPNGLAVAQRAGTDDIADDPEMREVFALEASE